MNTLARYSLDQGNRITVAGIALDTLADLLNGGTADYELQPDQIEGLCYAVRSIAYLVKDAGYGLCTRAEQEGQV